MFYSKIAISQKALLALCLLPLWVNKWIMRMPVKDFVESRIKENSNLKNEVQ